MVQFVSPDEQVAILDSAWFCYTAREKVHMPDSVTAVGMAKEICTKRLRMTPMNPR
jgi:hypothetical protein